MLLGFLTLGYSLVFMIVGFQMTYRLKTHFIDEYRDKDYGGLLRRVMWILSLFTMFLFVSTFLWLVFKPGLHDDVR